MIRQKIIQEGCVTVEAVSPAEARRKAKKMTITELAEQSAWEFGDPEAKGNHTTTAARRVS
jgi:hypothetical protein